MEFALLGFGLAWDSSLLPSFLFLSFEMDMSILCITNIVFWKHITCLFAQVHSWRGILPQEEFYLESHPYLI